MKKYFRIISVVLVSILAMSFTGFSASANNQGKTARQLKKELYGNTDKMVKKESKRLEKEGWKTMDMPIEKMLQRTWEKEFMTDENGDPRYIYVTTEATANTFAAAQMECENLAKIRIASNISSSVASLAGNSLSNNQIDPETANTLSQASENSKVLVSRELGRLVNSLCIYKQTPTNFTVRTTFLYDMQKSMNLVLDAVNKGLSEKEKDQLREVLNAGNVIKQYEKINEEE